MVPGITAWPTGSEALGMGSSLMFLNEPYRDFDLCSRLKTGALMVLECEWLFILLESTKNTNPWVLPQRFLFKYPGMRHVR